MVVNDAADAVRLTPLAAKGIILIASSLDSKTTGYLFSESWVFLGFNLFRMFFVFFGRPFFKFGVLKMGDSLVTGHLFFQLDFICSMLLHLSLFLV